MAVVVVWLPSPSRLATASAHGPVCALSLEVPGIVRRPVMPPLPAGMAARPVRLYVRRARFSQPRRLGRPGVDQMVSGRARTADRTTGTSHPPQPPMRLLYRSHPALHTVSLAVSRSPMPTGQMDVDGRHGHLRIPGNCGALYVSMTLDDLLSLARMRDLVLQCPRGVPACVTR